MGTVPGVAPLVIALTCAFTVLSLRPQPVATAPPTMIREAVVMVALRNSEGKRLEIGTAFHIGDGWFRTVAHVVRRELPKRRGGQDYDQWAFYSSDEFGNPMRYLGAFEIICVDRRWVNDPDRIVFPHDSALLRIKDTSVPEVPLRTSRSRPRVGDSVSVWGFPNGAVLFESRAKVVDVSDRWIEVREDVGRPVIGGHSGAPVVNAEGEVVGVMSARIEGIGQRGIAVPIRDAEIGCPRP